MKTMKKMILTVVATAVIAVSAWAQQVIVLAPGEPYTLTSESPATGTGTVSYQWYRNGNTISGATSASYNLPASEAKGINVEFKRGATTPSCGGYNFSNTIIITFCNTLAVGTICWAKANVDSYQQFAAIPDMYTKFYQWNKNTAWAATGSVSGWSSTANTATEWSVNPCPSGWRLPTQAEFQDLNNSGSTWAAASSARGNTVAGRFYGPNHSSSANCKLPSPMTNCIFLPAAGARMYSDGSLSNQGSDGFYWSGTQSSSSNGYSLNFNSSNSYPANGNTKAYGFSVRCVQ